MTSYYERRADLIGFTMSFAKLIKTLAVVVAACMCVLLAAASARAFHIDEKLNYDLSWYGIHAGKSMLHIYRGEDDVLRMVSTARSADWITVFYPVEDRAECEVEDERPWYPKRYHLKTREGKHRKNKEVLFDRHEGKAIFINHLEGKRKEYDIPSEIFDPLSGFYHSRFVDLVVGKSSYVAVFDSEDVWNVEVKVLKKEKVTVPAGTFDTVLINPKLKSEGIFSKKGDIYVWLTDDERRIPVKLKTKVAVGSITAELVNIEQ
jgi:hypothetical protein